MYTVIVRDPSDVAGTHANAAGPGTPVLQLGTPPVADRTVREPSPYPSTKPFPTGRFAHSGDTRDGDANKEEGTGAVLMTEIASVTAAALRMSRVSGTPKHWTRGCTSPGCSRTALFGDKLCTDHAE